MEINDKNFLKEIYTLLVSEGIEVWVFGGWAEELQNIIKPRSHNDVDLLYLGKDFSYIDDFIKKYSLQIIKNYTHKRAFLYKNVVIEIFLVNKREDTFITNFNLSGNNYEHIWPIDIFSSNKIFDLNVVSIYGLHNYRENHASIRAVIDPS